MTKELYLLKSSASASIRGYHYQFLKTLEAWLRSYINYDEEIFCENEDDFVEKHLGAKIYRFNQIKCYTNEISLGSDAIKKSLINFYKIYQSFEGDDYRLEFHLHSNSKPNDNNILSEWFYNQDTLSQKLLSAIVESLTPILNAISEDLGTQTNLIPFIQSIKWSFESKEPQEAISYLIDNIKSLILKIPDSKTTQNQTELILTKLYYKVVNTCCLSDNKVRRLTHEILINTISEEDDDWYVRTKGDWRSYDVEKYTVGDFIAIRVAAIHSMYTTYLNHDIEFWISVLEDVVSKERTNEFIKRKALYEIVVFSLRVLKRMENQREHIFEYANNIELFVDQADLNEAVILLNYLNVAKSSESFTIPVEKEEICNWISRLGNVIDNEIEQCNNQIQLCNLYFIKGNFLFFFSKPSEQITGQNDYSEESISWYERVIPNLHLIPLFSVATLLYILEKHLQIYLEFKNLNINKLEILISKIDDYYRENRLKAYESLKNRAITYLKSNEYTRALDIFHRLDRETYHIERLYLNTTIKISIGDCYRIIGLSHASMRFCFLAINQIITNLESKPELIGLLPKVLMLAIRSCNSQGYWIFQIFYIRAYYLFSEKFIGYSNTSKFEDENEIFGNLINIYYINDRFNLISKTKLGRVFPLGDEFYKKVNQGLNESRKIFKKVTKKTLWNQLEEQMIDYPFNDYTRNRTISWKAYGIEWSVIFELDYDMLFKVERFVSSFQIFLAELSDIDLCLPINLSVQIKCNNTAKSTFDIKRAHKNNNQTWEVSMSSKSHENEEIHFFQLSSTIILELSLLNNSTLLNIINEDLLIRKELALKTKYSAELDELKELLINRNNFNKVFANTKVSKPFDFASNLKNILKPFTNTGITYNKENNLTQISNRYSKIAKCNKYTLARIIKEPRVKIAIKRLKSEGYLDWHILACIFNVKINFIANQLYKKINDFEFCIEEAKRIGNMPEEIKSYHMIPIEEFSYEKLRKEMKRYVLATLQSYNLEFKNYSPPYEAIEYFLIKRYKFKTDDIPHPNFWQGEGLD